MLNRIQTIAVALASLGLAASALAADDFPTRPVTIIVASTAGGGTDIVSRIVGEQLSKQLGQPFVVDNRPGAGSVTGTEFAARAAPDGYTLQTGLNASMAVNPSLFAHLPYDPVADFAPVGMLAEFPFAIVVCKNFPAQSIKELIAMAKAHPGEINYASAGNGTGQQLSMELFKLMTGTNFTHVPYRGAAPAYTDVISGQVPVFIDNLASALGQIKGGNVRALAVTSKERSPLLPDVPTVEEAGVPGYVYYTWFGLVGAEEDAAADHRQAQRRSEKSRRRAGGEGPHRRRGRRDARHAACRHRAVPQSRDRQMGRRGQTRRHQGRVGASVNRLARPTP